MSYRMLEIGEVVRAGDEIKEFPGFEWKPIAEIWNENKIKVEDGYLFRRPIPTATFEEPADFEPSVSVSREPVDDYEISQHSADEVIYPIAHNEADVNDTDVVEWNGEGLPPVGIECEANWLELPDGGSDNWVRGIIASRYGNDVWFRPVHELSVVMDVHAIEFRPIKSAAELEAEERDNTIANAVHSLPKEEMASIEWGAHAERIIESLYDSGRLTKES